MKFLLILILSLFSISAFAKDLQRSAEQRFLHETEIPLSSGPFKFTFPIIKVEISDIANPRFFIGNATEDFRQEIRYQIGMPVPDTDYVHILLVTEAQKINCYAHFEEGKFKSLDHCTRREGDYGPLEELN